jgi:hypothetical protein
MEVELIKTPDTKLARYQPLSGAKPTIPVKSVTEQRKELHRRMERNLNIVKQHFMEAMDDVVTLISLALSSASSGPGDSESDGAEGEKEDEDDEEYQPGRYRKA